MSRTVRVAWLYPTDMSTYGDAGNVRAVVRRFAELGLSVVVDRCDPGTELRDDVDLLVGGGGQDSGQGKVHEDLLGRGPLLTELALDGVPMLMVCGLFQLFGHRTVTAAGEDLPGIGLLDVHTRAEPGRLVGTVRARSDRFGLLVGYENHSGRTVLGPAATPLARVEHGGGNNGHDGTEGAVVHHVVGTYLHGPVLPLNPALTDALVRQAVRRRYGNVPDRPDGPPAPGAPDPAVPGVSPWVERARAAALVRR